MRDLAAIVNLKIGKGRGDLLLKIKRVVGSS